MESKLTETQKAFVLRPGAEGLPVAEVCRKAGISQATHFNWKKKYDGLLPTEMRRLKQLEDENSKLKKIVADLTLELAHVATRPKTTALELSGRVEYGTESQTPTVILSFALPAAGGFWRRRRLPRFEAGDLVGILAPGTDLPCFYSLASASTEGVLEICVRKQAGGLCSGFLHELPLGGRIEAFIRPNPAFRPSRGKAPVILIGAGTGIGPLAGFIRHNTRHRPMHLYWGGRHPDTDFLYGPELRQYVGDGRLARLNTAFSRVPGGGYVQDRLATDAAALRDLMQHGAQVLVCGGRDMAGGVARAFEAILQPLGLDLATLKSEGRYREDVY